VVINKLTLMILFNAEIKIRAFSDFDIALADFLLRRK